MFSVAGHETKRRNKSSSSHLLGLRTPCCFQWLRTKPIGATSQATLTPQDLWRLLFCVYDVAAFAAKVLQHCIPLLQTCPGPYESLAWGWHCWLLLHGCTPVSETSPEGAWRMAWKSAQTAASDVGTPSKMQRDTPHPRVLGRKPPPQRHPKSQTLNP